MAGEPVGRQRGSLWVLFRLNWEVDVVVDGRQSFVNAKDG
jgi:hypothetical protein